MFDKVSSKVGSTIGSQKKLIEKVLVVLILLEFAPFEVLGPRAESGVHSLIDPFLNPITNLMSNVWMRTLLFVVLLWSCCMTRDMNVFFLLCVYFIVSRRS